MLQSLFCLLKRNCCKEKIILFLQIRTVNSQQSTVNSQQSTVNSQQSTANSQQKMKAATLKEIKTELSHVSHEELLRICLHLAKFKKENKELLTYLLLESESEEGYIETVKEEVDELFTTINTKSYFYMKKTIRKILRTIKTNIRYSKKKETEIELILYFCEKLKKVRPSIQYSLVLKNLYERELISLQKKISVVHEDLQYDYNLALNELKL